MEKYLDIMKPHYRKQILPALGTCCTEVPLYPPQDRTGEGEGGNRSFQYDVISIQVVSIQTQAVKLQKNFYSCHA